MIRLDPAASFPRKREPIHSIRNRSSRAKASSAWVPAFAGTTIHYAVCSAAVSSSCPFLNHAATQILNNFGQDGWELVSIIPSAQGNDIAYFKRPAEG